MKNIAIIVIILLTIFGGSCLYGLSSDLSDTGKITMIGAFFFSLGFIGIIAAILANKEK